MRATFIVAIGLLVACGGTSASVGDGDGGSDAHAGDGGACVDAVEGAACATGDVACDSGGNRCCIGYVWLCDSTTHKWNKAGLGCACQPEPDASTRDAGPFACGNVMCKGSEFCTDHPPGIPGPDGGTLPDSYQCSPIPSGCEANPTCACVQATLGMSCEMPMCTTDSSGHLTFHCLGV